MARKLSLVQTLPRGSRVCFSLLQEGASLYLQKAPCLSTPPRGQHRTTEGAAHVQAEEAAVCGWVGAEGATWEE